jgi:hypothetical protein
MYGPIAEKDMCGLPGPRKQHRQLRPALPVPEKDFLAMSVTTRRPRRSRMKRDPWRDAGGLLQEGNELQVLPFSSHLAPIGDA